MSEQNKVQYLISYNCNLNISRNKGYSGYSYIKIISLEQNLARNLLHQKLHFLKKS